ncbi:amidase [Mangrovibrevibacter kandeliae]|uniref:amidase n=1 Tax=Mangrovibrevibacter kandeliae TaxID=2968473 RepID=UPI002117DF0B|nr:amidase [Aurantimonas sp. CSK15Z-1]MCQ8783944.1 amidase [Aurantimonas sp. CSK15Z-1]
MSLIALRRAIENGHSSVAESVRDARTRVDALEATIGAFAHRAPPETIEAAERAEGPLAGIPIGVKDIYDSFDMPTEHGSPIHRGRRPLVDAPLVAETRRLGGAILGKTVTTPFAFLDPTATRNPHDYERTPGGSSSGSAAAVASGMVAAAFGSQTVGSTIRPASFCGIAGYKPSFRLLTTVGMKTLAWSLDTVGLLAAGVADVALFAALLSGRDLAVSEGAPQPGGGDASAMPRRIGVYRSTIDARLSPDMREAWTEASHRLAGDGCDLVEVAETAILSEAREIQPVILGYEAARALTDERLRHHEALSPKLRARLDDGAAVDPDAYDEARRIARHARKAATALFDGVDALLLPSALGVAPLATEGTGDPIMNALWTLTGNPCVSVPGARDPQGLPLGLSIVTRFGRDREALALGHRLEALLAAP